MTFLKNGFQVPGNPNAKFSTMEEYIQMARKEVGYFCGGTCSVYRDRISKDEDLISLIVYANMLADWRYDPKVHLCSPGTFRLACAKGTIFKIIKDLYKRSSNKIEMDLDRDYIDEKDSAENTIIKKEELGIAIKRVDELPARSAEIIKRHYLDNEPLVKIGDSMGISRQRVHQILEVSIRELRKNKELVND